MQNPDLRGREKEGEPTTMEQQKIAILTDSCADLTPELIGGAPIYTVPLKIRCPDGEFDDGVSIHAEEIYARLKAGQLPKTSLPSGESVERVLRRIQADGYQRVAAILLSSGLSGTYNLVRLIAQEWQGLEIAVFDTLSGALGEGAIALQAAADIQGGMSWEELTGLRIPRLIRSTFPFFSVDTLEYLVWGGRLGKITGAAGALLKIKPLITFAKDGELVNVAKVRGRKAVPDKLIELVRESLGEHKRYNLAVANGGAPEEMAALKRRMQAEFPDYEQFWQAEINATFSTYIGDGILGAAVMVLD